MGRREGEARYPQDQGARIERDLPRNFMDATPSMLAEPKKVFFKFLPEGIRVMLSLRVLLQL